MRPTRPLVGLVVLAASSVVAAASVVDALQAPPGDGPVREPVEVWSTDTGCDSAAGGRACSLAVGRDVVYLFEHALADDPEAGRLRAIDPVTGEERWTTETAAAERMTVSHAAVVLGDKSHIEVVEPATGTIRLVRPGRLVGLNDYGIVLVESPADTDGRRTIEAVDTASGTTSWTVEPGLEVGVVCRDLVVLVPAWGAAPQTFRVVEHHTGATRFSGEEPFDPATDTLRCNGPWLYTTDGDSITEWDSVIGWLNWETAIDGGADAVEIYRDVALITSADGDAVTAVKRETGEIMWSEPAAGVGSLVSAHARLRRDESTVFMVSPLTGAVVHRVELPHHGDASARFVAASECRLVVAVGTTIVTYGVRDLTETWTLELDDAPGDLAVVDGTLVVRVGGDLVGYRSPDRDMGPDTSAVTPPCTF